MGYAGALVGLLLSYSGWYCGTGLLVALRIEVGAEAVFVAPTLETTGSVWRNSEGAWRVGTVII